MKAARAIAFALMLVLPSISALAQPEPPDDFLQAQTPAWRQVLKNPIILNFRDADITSVAAALGEQGLCQIVVDVPRGQKVPLVTRKFHRTSLRMAIYQVTQDTGLRADWIYAGKIPQIIRLY